MLQLYLSPFKSRRRNTADSFETKPSFFFFVNMSFFPSSSGFLCVTSGPYIPSAAISITVQCLAQCQLLLDSQPAPRRLVLSSFFFFLFLSGRKQQPIVRGGAGRCDRGGKLMKLFDGSPDHRARGEVQRTSAWH